MDAGVLLVTNPLLVANLTGAGLDCQTDSMLSFTPLLKSENRSAASHTNTKQKDHEGLQPEVYSEYKCSWQAGTVTI